MRIRDNVDGGVGAVVGQRQRRLQVPVRLHSAVAGPAVGDGMRAGGAGDADGDGTSAAHVLLAATHATPAGQSALESQSSVPDAPWLTSLVGSATRTGAAAHSVAIQAHVPAARLSAARGKPCAEPQALHPKERSLCANGAD